MPGERPRGKVEASIRLVHKGLKYNQMPKFPLLLAFIFIHHHHRHHHHHEDRLLFCTTAFAQRYYEFLNRQAAVYRVNWREQDEYSSSSKCGKLVNHLVETPTSEEEVLVAMTVIITTGRSPREKKRGLVYTGFPVLLECVHKLIDIKHFAGISSTPDQYQSIFASSLHNFFVNFIHFVSEEVIPSSNCKPTDDLSQEKITPKATSLSAPDVELPLPITPNRLKTISSLRDTLGELAGSRIHVV